ncbi:hypothetical protein BJ170DRAFT_606089 [Xylariales sp. AK1849]|nr:hypothetical protein BJ170DRAFT_606089 [Xylariales sp. AK1849]
MNSTARQLRDQWANPGDILSLLLLIGGDIVQKAIAQLVGHKIRLPGERSPGLPITPVAFSFGWAAYAFSNLLAATGDMRLMPPNDSPSMSINCSNGFVRETRSWVLGRLLRDHETRSEIDVRAKDEGGRAESIRIDIFNLGPVSTPSFDFVWWLGWVTLLAQIGIAIVSWVLYGDWGIAIITFCGNLLAAITCAMPQWTQEKWAGRKLECNKVTCLTRGNGHPHIMVFIGAQGSWDLESLATGTSVPRSESRWISLVLAISWTCLLISISGLKDHTWFLVCIGGIGMLQNVFAAGTSRKPAASNFHITKFSRAPTIIGRREDYADDPDVKVDLEETLERLADISTWASEKPKPPVSQITPTPDGPLPMPQWLVSMSKEDGVPSWLEAVKPDRINQASSTAQPVSRFLQSGIRGSVAGNNKRNDVIHAVGVHGALMELEKWVPTAGLAMVQVFFSAGLNYNDDCIRDNIHKKFWQRAYYTRAVRKRAEEKRLIEERSQALVEV